MKRILLSLVFVATSIVTFSQANVTSSAISVQGIARNSSNNAVSNSSLSITAELYYINSSNTAVSILTRTGTINTDAFGVFAYVVDIASADFLKIANSEAWIKISSGGVTFAQEKLMAVPYALHAQNGAPTGSIMPYVGTTAPAGWLLCDGGSIPTGVYYDQLRIILGGAAGDGTTKVPDLRGMFLRGAGTNTVANYTGFVGPSLGARQLDGVKDHVHPFTSSSATTSAGGEHAHNFAGNAGGSSTLANGVSYDRTLGNGDEVSYPTSTAAAHTHTVTVSGTTNNNTNGITENRPANYGVNYIIKI